MKNRESIPQPEYRENTVKKFDVSFRIPVNYSNGQLWKMEDYAYRGVAAQSPDEAKEKALKHIEGLIVPDDTPTFRRYSQGKVTRAEYNSVIFTECKESNIE